MSVTIIRGDARSIPLANESVHAIVCDPPYGIEFGGLAWDTFSTDGAGRSKPFPQGSKEGKQQGRAFREWCETWAAEALRVLKPGGYLLAFGAARAYHNLATAIEDAGFELRDCISWIYACLSEDTEILVDGQWERYDKAIAGSLALCYNQSDGTFSWQPIQGLHVYQHDDTAVRVHSDLTDQIVTRNHRCLVERDGAFQLEEAGAIAQEREARVPVLENVLDLLRCLPVRHEGAGCQIEDLQLEGLQVEHDPHDASGASPHGTARGNEADSLCGVRQGCVETSSLVEGCQEPDVLPALQRNKKDSRNQFQSWPQVALDSREHGVLFTQDDRLKQPGMEGRGNVLQEARKLQANQVRSMPTGVTFDGEEGRLCDGASPDSGSFAGEAIVASGDSSSRGPRSAEQHGRESVSVCDQSGPQAVRASRFTSTTLARFELVDYRGVVWCVTVPTGAFVARRNGKVFITGNSGFPKSMSASKAIDKHLGAERRKIRIPAKEACNPSAPGRGQEDWSVNGRPWMLEAQERGFYECDGDEPASWAAAQWDGWGTALRPSFEPCVVARKPLEGTVAESLLLHGTGAINVDGCRLFMSDEDASRIENMGGFGRSTLDSTEAASGAMSKGRPNLKSKAHDAGRYPPNVVCLGDEMGTESRYYRIEAGAEAERNVFPCPKPSSAERGAGRKFPTVKPVTLMRWLVRLVTHPGGTVLDPFAGSGTTGLAALAEGRRCILLDRFTTAEGEFDAQHLAVVRARVMRADRVGENGEPEIDHPRLPFAEESA